jgi:hypothetical protein
MKKPLEEENTLLQAGIIETSDIESKDTLYRLMSTIPCSIAMAPLSGRSFYIHLTQAHLAVAIFSSILSLS